MAAPKPFQLSAQLAGHGGDVRAVAYKSEDVIVSASRDRTVRMWTREKATSPQTSPTFDSVVVGRSESYINSIAVIPPSDQHPLGLIISGGSDAVIQVHEPRPETEKDSEFPLAIPGHSSNCCALAVSPLGNFFVSGGWDARAQIVHVGGTWGVAALLDGHSASVNTVVALDNVTVLTGCSDNNIRSFSLMDLSASSSTPAVPAAREISAQSPVRALCRLPTGHTSGADYASATNDCVIRLWTFDGRPVAELFGHENFIYSLATLPTGEIVSSSEDRTLRIWRNNECVQTITHPTESVWSVAVCPTTGDIVSGAADGLIRVFTRSESRVADADTLKSFEESVKQSAVPKETLGDLKDQEFPGPDFLETRSGTKDGQTQVIKNPDGSMTAHSWSAAQNKWELVGSVVDSAPRSAGKKISYKGKQWDYLLPVDVDETKPPLQLPYNVSEDPYTAARSFLEDNELPISYLEAVATHIVRETKGAHLEHSRGGQGQSAPDASGAQTAPESLYYPQKEYAFLATLNSAPVLSKIVSINDALVKSGDKEYAMNPKDVSTLKDIASELEDRMKEYPVVLNFNARVPETSMASGRTSEIHKLVRIATHWEYPNRLPALDLLRCLVFLPRAAEYRHPTQGDLIDVVLSSAFTIPDSAKAEAKPANLVMMSMRAVANVFASPEGRQLAIAHFSRVVSLMEAVLGINNEGAPFKGPIGADNKNLAVAVSTVAMNYAVLAASSPKDESGRPTLRQESLMLLVNCIGAILQENRDPNTVSRALAALGTIASIDAAMRKNVKALGGADWARLAKDRVPDNQAKARAAELVHLLG